MCIEKLFTIGRHATMQAPVNKEWM
jgi:hypothetical protein